MGEKSILGIELEPSIEEIRSFPINMYIKF